MLFVAALLFGTAGENEPLQGLGRAEGGGGDCSTRSNVVKLQFCLGATSIVKIL